MEVKNGDKRFFSINHILSLIEGANLDEKVKPYIRSLFLAKEDEDMDLSQESRLGLWSVSTEYDSSTPNLGVFFGNVEDILFQLGSLSGYYLMAEKVGYLPADRPGYIAPTKNRIVAQIKGIMEDVDDPQLRANAVRLVLQDVVGVGVDVSHCSGCVELVYSQKLLDKQRRAEILSKLSPEDLEILKRTGGLPK